MTIITRFGKLALCAMLVAGLAGCKKDKKDGEPAAKASGSGSASASGTGTGTGTGTSATAPKTEGGQAMAAIKGAIAKADGKDTAPSGGGLGGMGSALGGLFGGGGARAAAVEPGAPPMGEDKGGQPTSVDVGDEPPPGGHDPGGADPYANMKLPPPGKAGGSCTDVADRIVGMVEMMYSDPAMMGMGVDMEGMDEATKKMVEEQMKAAMEELKAQIGPMREQMLTMCESQKWSQELKDCVLLAEKMDALQGCEKLMTDEQRNADFDSGEEPPEPPAPDQPAPAWSGGDDCAAVGQRIAQLALNQAGDVGPDEKKMMEEAMKEATTQITEMCNQGQWSADVRSCFLKAGTIQDAEVCFGNIGT